jgi:hypothetical protein
VHVRIEAGGSVTLHADGDGASPDRTAAPTGGPPAALTVSATTLETVSATLSGGAAITRVEVLEPFRPVAQPGTVRWPAHACPRARPTPATPSI